VTEPTEKSFGYLTFSTLVHSAAAAAIILLPQLERMPEGNTYGEVIEFTTADGPMPLGETLEPDPAEGELEDSMPALAAEPAGPEDVDAVKVAAAPAPAPEPLPAESDPLPAPEPIPIEPAETQAEEEPAQPKVVEAPDRKELSPKEDNLQKAMAIAAAEEAAIEQALEEQRRAEAAQKESEASAKAMFNDDNSDILAAQKAEEEAIAKALEELQREDAAAAALVAQQEAEADRLAKQQAEAEQKLRADQAEAAALAAKQKAEEEAKQKQAQRVAAEKERKQREFQEKLRKQAEEAELARLAAIENQKQERTRREALAAKAREDLQKLNNGQPGQRTLGQANNQNAQTPGTQVTGKAIGSPQGKIRDYRDIVQLPGNIPPQYPVAARRNRQEGLVKLAYFVNSDGTVRDVKILKSSGYQMLDQEAVVAVERYRYKPGQAGWALHPVSFQLRGEEEAAFGRLRRAGP
jgi:TonB family protein